MLVYCANLWLQSDLDAIYATASAWLLRSRRIRVRPSLFHYDDQRVASNGMRVLISKTGSDDPLLQCIQLSHGDMENPGRRWLSEIGIYKHSGKSDIECSILLKTDEISPRVEGKIQITVPHIVHDLIENCKPSNRTPGLRLTTLDTHDDAEAFSHSLDLPERRYPYVLVSPRNGDYLVDVKFLRYLLEGVAEVTIIPAGMNTYKLGDILGPQNVVWGGAINVIFPEAFTRDGRFIPHRRILPDAIEALGMSDNAREREILSTVMHRVNLPNSWRHVSLEKVAEQKRKDERARLQKAAGETGKTAEYVAFLEEYAAETDEKARNAELKAEEFESLFLQVDDDLRQVRREKDDLALSFSYASKPDVVHVPDYLTDILETISKRMTPAESLRVIARVFQNRLVVLNSAWKAADESSEFRERKKAFDLLWKLATDYWQILADGRGDAEARAVFGRNEFASNEGEIAGNNKRARLARTFEHEGKIFEMTRHLKIGVKDSPAETLRVHFEWDADRKKIVVGYCGPHLPHK